MCYFYLFAGYKPVFPNCGCINREKTKNFSSVGIDSGGVI